MTTHTIRTCHTKYGGGGYHCSVARLFPHHYGKHTAFGDRVVMKPKYWKELGKFPDRKSALAAGRDWVNANKPQPINQKDTTT